MVPISSTENVNAHHGNKHMYTTDVLVRENEGGRRMDHRNNISKFSIANEIINDNDNDNEKNHCQIT